MCRVASFDDLGKLVYHRMVLKEALRLYPSAPLRGRTLRLAQLFPR